MDWPELKDNKLSEEYTPSGILAQTASEYFKT